MKKLTEFQQQNKLPAKNIYWRSKIQKPLHKYVTLSTTEMEVWQLQPKVVQRVQQHFSYEFISIRRACEYI